MKRRNVLLLVVASVLVSSLATWVANEQIRSPAEAAAQTAAPVPTPILVPVEEKVLVTKVVTRGTAQYRSPQKLTVTSSFLKSGPQIVTSTPQPGTKVREADVLLTISGRPVFLMYGVQPSFRDLGPGMSGPDVTQLEKALRRAGLNPGVVDGVYDAATGQSVASLYRRNGFEPFVADAGELADRRPPEAALVAGGSAGPGVQLPADEVIYVAEARLQVTEVLSAVGSEPGEALITVTDLDVVVDGQLPVNQAALVVPGTKVVLDESGQGLSTTGVVSRVASGPGTGGADSFHVSFRVTVSNPPAALVGSSVRITVPIESTVKATLTVPVSALSLAPDGGSRVRRSVDGELSYVQVTAGLAADGYVAVTPTSGTLEVGDQVVIGFETREQAGG
ncbi:MAG TPA: peptidoglycan-binding domain-containing protein [Nocardioidaceae bacterium]|nr:peptidoglycan-binding domain-containing protein [Nocardioidaceae bacterium]